MSIKTQETIEGKQTFRIPLFRAELARMKHPLLGEGKRQGSKRHTRQGKFFLTFVTQGVGISGFSIEKEDRCQVLGKGIKGEEEP